MVIALLIPIVLSCLLLAAHFLHGGSLSLMALSLIVPLVLFIRHRYAVRTVQAVLTIAFLEWLRTVVVLTEQRMDTGTAWKRMAIILGAVAIWSLGSALLLETPPMRRRYRRNKSDKTTPDSKTP